MVTVIESVSGFHRPDLLRLEGPREHVQKSRRQALTAFKYVESVLMTVSPDRYGAELGS